jgi:hypothetical protein
MDNNNNLSFALRLGPSSPQHDGGIVSLTVPTPSTNSSSPALLQVYGQGQNVQIVTSSSNTIAQVIAPEGLVNVHTFSPYEYHLECFYSSNVVTNFPAPYGTNGAAFATYVIINTNGAANSNVLSIINEETNENYQYQYTYNPTNGAWSMLEPDGQTLVTTWRTANSTNAAITNSFKTISVGSDTLSQVERVRKLMASRL